MVAEPTVCIKNTFIDFAQAPAVEILNRAQSEFDPRSRGFEAYKAPWSPLFPPLADAPAPAERAADSGPATPEGPEEEGEESGPRVCVKNTFIHVVEEVEEPGLTELRRAQSDKLWPSPSLEDLDTEVGSLDDPAGSPLSGLKLTSFAPRDEYYEAEAACRSVILDRECEYEAHGIQDLAPPPVPGLNRFRTLDGFDDDDDEPEPVAGAWPGEAAWMEMSAQRALGEEQPNFPMDVAHMEGQLATAAQVQPSPPQGYTQAIMYVPMAVPLHSMPPEQCGAQAVYPWSGQAEAALPAEPLPPVIEDAAGEQPTPGALGLVRVSSLNSTVQRFCWTVDARKLKGSDRRAVSPAFSLYFSGPVQFRPVQFKLLLHPTPSGDKKGDCSFKKVRGRGRVELNCQQLLEARDEHPVQFRVAVGSEAPRGPVRHDFSAQTSTGLPEGSHEWEFSKHVDPRTDTFTVHLEVVAGAEAARATAADFDAVA